MNNSSRKAQLFAAVTINVILFAALITVFVDHIDSLLLIVLLASLTHISLCGSLLYFTYVSPASSKDTVQKAGRSSCMAVTAAK